MTAKRAVASNRSSPRAACTRSAPALSFIERLEGRMLCDASGIAAVATYTNPVINRDFADPGVVQVGGDYYAFATNSGGKNVQAARSTDLVHWVALPDALPTLPSWAVPGRTWAPDAAVTAAGTYVLYYTAWSRSTGRQAIGVATSDSPSGPFAPVGSEPLVTQYDQGGAIDPSVFTDANGSRYLLWKNDGNAVGQDTTLYVQPLSADGLGLVGSPTALIHQDQQWEGSLVEAPVLWTHAGKYYLFYSANNFASTSYATGYAVSDSLLGPYVKASRPFLTTSGAVIGPGGPEVVRAPDGNDWMLYHSWEGNFNYRSLSIDRVQWFGAVPTLKGPTRTPQPIPVPPEVVGRYAFYNHSTFDGGNAAATAADDKAIAADKHALLPGQSASFANVTSYTRGINGVMVDVSRLPDAGPTLNASSFGVEVSPGGAGGWSAGPTPLIVSVRKGAGAGGSDRVSLTWADGDIKDEWLRLTVRATASTGLAAADVFLFGNLAGDTGAGRSGAGAAAAVDAFDVAAIRRGMFSTSPVTGPLDFDRDGRVTALDLAAARANVSRVLLSPGAGAAPVLSVAATDTPSPAATRATALLSDTEATLWA